MIVRLIQVDILSDRLTILFVLLAMENEMSRAKHVVAVAAVVVLGTWPFMVSAQADDPTHHPAGG
jgi:hypothetical protein